MCFGCGPESKTRLIKIGQIVRREDSPARVLLDAVNLKPTESQHKIGIIVAADRMNDAAANAFLKTLEEPPPRSLLILLTTEPQRLLETILSRCLRLNFAGEGPRQWTPAQMEWLAAFSEMAAAEQKSLIGRYRLMDVLLRKLNEVRAGIEETLQARSPLEKYEDAEETLRDQWEQELKAAVEAEYRRQRADFLLALEWWLRDVWLQTLGEDRGSESAVHGPQSTVHSQQSEGEPASAGSASGETRHSSLATREGLLVFPQLAGTKRVAQRLSPQGGAGEPAYHRATPALAAHQRPGSAGPGSRAAEAAVVRAQGVADNDGQLLPSLFAALLGAFLGLALLKFGNPPILEKYVSTPTQFYDFVFAYPWPITWAYCGLGLVGVLGVAVARWKPVAPKWLIALPLVWLVWEFIAATQSLDRELTAPTVKHFGACVLCFYLGLFSLSRVRNPWPFWAGLLCGLVLVLHVGWDQHFGGLQATRRYFYLYFYQQIERSPAGISEADFKLPHLRDALLSQRAGGTVALAAAGSAGRDLGGAPPPDRPRPGAPPAITGSAGTCMPVLVRVQGRLAADAVPGPGRAAAAAFQQTAQDRLDCSRPAGRAGGVLLEILGFLPEGRHQCQRPVRLLAGGASNRWEQAGLRHWARHLRHPLREDQTARVRNGAVGAQRLPGAGLGLRAGRLRGLHVVCCWSFSIHLPTSLWQGA